MQIFIRTPHDLWKQQKDLTLAAYVHHFKTAAKWWAFDNDTAVIGIFVKGLWDEHTTAG